MVALFRLSLRRGAPVLAVDKPAVIFSTLPYAVYLRLGTVDEESRAEWTHLEQSSVLINHAAFLVVIKCIVEHDVHVVLPVTDAGV